MRTDEEIQSEIALLQKLKPSVPKVTAFGDDNHNSIDAQIDVLTNKMSEDRIYEIYGDEEDLDFSEHTLNSALDAFMWMTEENDESTSSEWEVFAK